MSVYVDDAKNRYGKMLMCHLMADSTAQLLSMARKIGVNEKWLQNRGSIREHFDICQAKRKLAVSHGAVQVTSGFLVHLRQLRDGD